MATAAIIEHVGFEDLGSWEPVLREHGFTLRHYQAGVSDLADPELREAALLVVLGGPISVNDSVFDFLSAERSVLAARLAADQPTVGVCLGAQLMAAALGCHVRAMREKEIGFAQLQLTDRGRAVELGEVTGLPVLHWHGEQVALPAGATLLASTARCHNQAFAVGRNGLALQFHLELEPAKFERWLIGHCVELGLAGIDISELRAQAAAHGPALRSAGQQVLRRWLTERGL